MVLFKKTEKKKTESAEAIDKLDSMIKYIIKIINNQNKFNQNKEIPNDSFLFLTIKIFHGKMKCLFNEIPNQISWSVSENGFEKNKQMY